MSSPAHKSRHSQFTSNSLRTSSALTLLFRWLMLSANCGTELLDHPSISSLLESTSAQMVRLTLSLSMFSSIFSDIWDGKQKPHHYSSGALRCFFPHPSTNNVDAALIKKLYSHWKTMFYKNL